MIRKTGLLFAALVFSAQLAFAATYQVDPVHSQVEFTVDHLMVFKVSGSFNDYQGEIIADPASRSIESATAAIKVASIDTRESKRDDHLRSADFFDAENYPTMTFVSKRIEGQGNDITVHGDLTIRGTTREVALRGKYRGENTDPWGNVRAGFSASTLINRHDYGLNWNKALETGGFVVGDEVTINLEIQGVRK
ncbi:MAG TPA: YceI family protein [Desulfuromonadales bacterium]|nr:YceI family protein [Desulfuromonadales bacterium]